MLIAEVGKKEQWVGSNCKAHPQGLDSRAPGATGYCSGVSRVDFKYYGVNSLVVGSGLGMRMNEPSSIGRNLQPTEGQVRILLLFAKGLCKI